MNRPSPERLTRPIRLSVKRSPSFDYTTPSNAALLALVEWAENVAVRHEGEWKRAFMFLLREHPKAPRALQVSEGATHVSVWQAGGNVMPFAIVSENEPPFVWKVAEALGDFGVSATYELHPSVVEVRLDEKRLMVCGTSNEFWCCDVREGGEVLNSHQLTILSNDERDAREVAKEIAELVHAFDKGEGKKADAWHVHTQWLEDKTAAISIHGTGGVIAVVARGTMNELTAPQMLQHAKLLAAAPELLEQLECLVGIICSLNGFEERDVTIEDCDEAKAVIRKVKGE